MAKQLDPVVAETLKKYGFGKDAAWDCHGTWVVYHRVLEQIAAKAGVGFDAPLALEANGPAKTVALCVTGRLPDGRAEWSIGEAAPGNNKNAYPYAMAEKRAKDRVILKLIGLHGLVYSEEEADDFKAAPAPLSGPKKVVEQDPRGDAGSGTDIRYERRTDGPIQSGRFDLVNPEGEVEDSFLDREGFMLALGNIVKDNGLYWEPNVATVNAIGDEYQDEKTRKWIHRLRKLGETASKNASMANAEQFNKSAQYLAAP